MWHTDEFGKNINELRGKVDIHRCKKCGKIAFHAMDDQGRSCGVADLEFSLERCYGPVAVPVAEAPMTENPTTDSAVIGPTVLQVGLSSSDDEPNTDAQLGVRLPLRSWAFR